MNASVSQEELVLTVNFCDYDIDIPLTKKSRSFNSYFLLPCPVLDPATVAAVYDPITNKHLVTCQVQLANQELLKLVAQDFAARKRKKAVLTVIPSFFAKFLLNQRALDAEIDPWLTCRERWVPVRPGCNVHIVELECPTKAAAIHLSHRMRTDKEEFVERWRMEFAVASAEPEILQGEVAIIGEDLIGTKLYRQMQMAKISRDGWILMCEHDIKLWAQMTSDRIAVRVLEYEKRLVDAREQQDIRKRVISVLQTYPIRYPDECKGYDWDMVYWSKKYLRPDRLRTFLNQRIFAVDYAPGMALYYKTKPEVHEDSMEGRIVTSMRFLYGPHSQKEGDSIIFSEQVIMQWFFDIGSPVYWSRNYREFVVDQFSLYQVDLQQLQRLLIAPRSARRRIMTVTEPVSIVSLPPLKGVEDSVLSRRDSMNQLNVLPDGRAEPPAVRVANVPRVAIVKRRPSTASGRQRPLSSCTQHGWDDWDSRLTAQKVKSPTVRRKTVLIPESAQKIPENNQTLQYPAEHESKPMDIANRPAATNSKRETLIANSYKEPEHVHQKPHEKTVQEPKTPTTQPTKQHKEKEKQPEETKRDRRRRSEGSPKRLRDTPRERRHKHRHSTSPRRQKHRQEEREDRDETRQQRNRNKSERNEDRPSRSKKVSPEPPYSSSQAPSTVYQVPLGQASPKIKDYLNLPAVLNHHKINRSTQQTQTDDSFIPSKGTYRSFEGPDPDSYLAQNEQSDEEDSIEDLLRRLDQDPDAYKGPNTVFLDENDNKTPKFRYSMQHVVTVNANSDQRYAFGVNVRTPKEDQCSLPQIRSSMRNLSLFD